MFKLFDQLKSMATRGDFYIPVYNGKTLENHPCKKLLGLLDRNLHEWFLNDPLPRCSFFLFIENMAARASAWFFLRIQGVSCLFEHI